VRQEIRVGHALSFTIRKVPHQITDCCNAYRSDY
jgi:hypothetical protein